MKYMLAVSVWCFSVLAGLWMRRRQRARWKTLAALATFFETIRLRMEYAALPLLPLLEENAGDLTFLTRCCAAVRAGESFSAAWSAAIRETTLPLDKDARDDLCALGALLGTTDLNGQLQILHRAGRTMEDLAQRARSRYEKYAPVCNGCGIFAGFALFVFMT